MANGESDRAGLPLNENIDNPVVLQLALGKSNAYVARRRGGAGT